MKKAQAQILIAIVILLLVAGIVGYFYSDQLFEFYPGEDCRNVYCDEYGFMCCQEHITLTYEKSLNTDIDRIECPHDATKCKVIYSEQVNTLRVGSNCKIVTSIFGGFKIDCSATESVYIGKEFRAGQWLYNAGIYGDNDVKVEYWREWLLYTGTSGSDTGIPKQDGICARTTDSSVYTDYGAVVTSSGGQIISYTVPIGQCYLVKDGRKLCGDTCEDCQTNADCVTGYPFVYNGQGAVCNPGGQLQLYGCLKSGIEVQEGFDLLPGMIAPEWLKQVCGVIDTINVDCCPGANECGQNMVCSQSTFKCVPTGEAPCTQDSDCKTETTCNRVKLDLEKWKCIAGSCEPVKLKDVECCTAQDCAIGWDCDLSDYTCKENPVPCRECPAECCENDRDDSNCYFDKPCPDSKPYCVKGDTVEENTCETDPPEFKWWKIVLGLIIVIAIISGIFYAYIKTR